MDLPEPRTDLTRDLAPLFADEPPLRPVDDRLRAGRRAVRRRRLGSAAGALAVVAVLGTSYAVTSGAPSADGGQVATTSSATPEPVVEPKAPEPTALTKYDQPEDDASQDRIRGFHLDYDTGEVTAVGAGVVHEVVPIDTEPGRDRAVGADVTMDGERTWWYLTWDIDAAGTGGASSVSDEPEAATTFADWVRSTHEQQSEALPTPDQDPVPLSEIADRFGNYTPPPGTEVLKRVDNPLGLRAPYTSTGVVVRDSSGVHTILFLPSSSTFKEGEVPIADLVAELSRPASFSAEGPMPPLTRSDADGMPVPRAGVEVLRTIDNPLGVAAPSRSVAFVMRFEGRDWWYLWELGPSGYNGAETVRVARDGYPDVEAWLADQKSKADW